jgi:hypothetical protein
MLSKQRRSIALTGVLLLAAPPADAFPEQRPEPPPRTGSESYREQLITTGRVTKVSSFEATSDGELRAEISPTRRIGTRQEQQTEPRGEPVRITLRPATLADSINELAGQRVKILNARVVGVFEPRAFLIESATRHETALGFRDRVLVLVDAASLRVSQELLVGSTVIILGVARSLLGVRVSPELPWPANLTPELIERLEVRAAVLATSVQTPEGIELTDRAPGDSETPRLAPSR